MKKDTLQIKYYGDPILQKKSSKIEEIDDEIRELVDKMLKAMRKNDGIGLAAPQVGISKSLIVLDVNSEYLQHSSHISPGEAFLLPQMPIALINSEIVFSSSDSITMEEGCLSVPEIYAPVTRPDSITLKAKMLSGEEINIDCAGFLSRAIQHEIDHLNGVVFIELLTAEDYKSIKKKLDKLQKRNFKKGFFSR